MSDENPAGINEDDIVFECPHCGKSLAINKTGMGLTIACPDCEKDIRVPTISDSNVEAADVIQMPSEALASALEESRNQVAELTNRLNELSAQRESLEKTQTTQQARMDQLRREFGNIQASLDRVGNAILED